MDMDRKHSIIFFTPFKKGNRGNSTTAKRIVTGLKKAGLDVLLFAYEEEELTPDRLNQIQGASLFHILHFTRFSKWKDKHNFNISKPFILTNGGTDINHDLMNQGETEQYRNLLETASAITVFTEDAMTKVDELVEHPVVKAIPQSVWFPSKSTSTDLQFREGYPNILLPAGLRKIKDIFYVMDEIIELKKVYSGLNFAVAGTVIEKEVYEELAQYIGANPWMTYYCDVPLPSMQSLYNWADIVLNTSISEGQSSSVLEALFMDCIVIARRNKGNESIIKDGYNGLLFESGDEFFTKISKLLDNKEKQKLLRTNGRNYVEKYHSHEQEIQSYISLYKEILARGE